MTTLHVMTNTNTPTPLQDTVRDGETKWWRLSKEDSERVTHVMIWDDQTNTKVKGKITEMGTHAELLDQGGLYADLWARQSGGFLAEDTAALTGQAETAAE